MRLKLRLLAALAVCALAVGCGDEDPTPGTTDTGGQDTTADAVADTGGADTVGDDTAPAVLEDQTHRLTGVRILQPSGVGPILEGLINTDIRNGKLHVLIQLSAFQGDWPTGFTLTGNAGTDVEGGYTWYPGVAVNYVPASIDADGFFAGDETLSIIFPALEPNETEPIQIPVSDLQLEGELYELDGTWSIEGVLSGAILASEITDITVNLGEERSLASLLGGEDEMDYPEDAPQEERTGWRLQAEVTADEVTFVEPAE